MNKTNITNYKMTNLDIDVLVLEELFEHATKEDRIKGIKEIVPQLKVYAHKQKVEYSKHGARQQYQVGVIVGDKKSYFTFHDSIANFGKKVDKLDVIYALVQDALAYEHHNDFEYFSDSFGYEDDKKGRKAFNGCRRTYEVLTDMLGVEDYVRLTCVFNGY